MRSQIKTILILSVLIINPLSMSASDQNPLVDQQPFTPSAVGDNPSTAIFLDVGVGNKYFDSLPGPSNNSGYWFRVELGSEIQSGDFAIIMNRSISASPNFNFYVYDENENYLNQALGSNPKTQFQYDVIGIFYIHVIPNGGSGDFDIFVEDQAVYNGERGYTPDHAMTILPDMILPGALPGPGANGEMWYDVELGYMGVLTNYRITLTIVGGSNFNVEIFESDLTFVGAANSTDNPDVFQISALGSYRLNVSAFTGSGNFTLHVESLIPPGFDEVFAIPIGLNTPTMDIMPDGEGLTTKFYRIVLGNGNIPDSYHVTILGDLNTDFQIALYDDEAYEYFSGVSQGPDSYSINAINIKGLYYITIAMLGNPGGYTLEITTFTPTGSSFNSAIPLGLDEEIYQEGVGNGTDNSFYYSISLDQTMYEFGIGMGFVGDDVSAFIYDSNQILIGSATTTLHNSEKNIRIHVEFGTHYIKVNSTTTYTRYLLSVIEIPFGSSPDNPFKIMNNHFEGDFSGAPLSQWLSFKLRPTVNPNNLELHQTYPNATKGFNITASANFDCDGGNGLDAHIYDTLLNLISEVDGGECPFSIEFTTSLDEILIEINPVFSEELPTYSVEMDCESCVEDVPTGGPAPPLGEFKWSFETENFYPYNGSVCPNKREITVIIEWNDMPPSYVNIIFDFIYRNDVFAAVKTWSSQIQGSGTDRTVYTILSTTNFEYGTVIKVYLNNGDQGKASDNWTPVCVERLKTIVTNGTTIYALEEVKKSGPNDLNFILSIFATLILIRKIRKDPTD